MEPAKLKLTIPGTPLKTDPQPKTSKGVLKKPEIVSAYVKPSPIPFRIPPGWTKGEPIA